MKRQGCRENGCNVHAMVCTPGDPELQYANIKMAVTGGWQAVGIFSELTVLLCCFLIKMANTLFTIC